VPAGRRAEACRACRATLTRGAGATIVVRAPGRAPDARPAAEWCEALPALNGDDEPLDGHATLRAAEPVERPVQQDGELLGFIERFGPQIRGVVTLAEDAIHFQPEDGGPERSWRFADLTAVQPASSALQLKARGEPVVSLRFTSCSVRLWERRIQNALRRLFRETGRGEIVEFQPRISTR
jgi:hypothetical protein